jgi:hypothetical protein
MLRISGSIPPLPHMPHIFMIPPNNQQLFPKAVLNVRFLRELEKLQKLTISFVMSVCPPVHVKQLGSRWTDFHEILYLSNFRKIGQGFGGTLHEAYQYTFLIISRSVILVIINVTDKSCRENQNTYFVFNKHF